MLNSFRSGRSASRICWDKSALGVESKGGFSLDPNDNGDETRQKCSNNLDLSLGTEASWGVNIGPYGLKGSSSTDFFQVRMVTQMI